MSPAVSSTERTMPAILKDPPRKEKHGPPPWRLRLAWMLRASVPVALLVGYMTWIAPGLVPVPEGLTVPSRAATEFLEKVCTWCGGNPKCTGLIALTLLLPGMFFRVIGERYSIRLTVVASAALLFVYFSISAPIDTMRDVVDEAIPEDNRTNAYR